MCEPKIKTRFIIVPVTNTPKDGIKIGDGECMAVRLKLNPIARNAATLANTPFVAYHGDAKKQEAQLIAVDTLGNARGEWTPKIYCTNLDQVFVRYRQVTGGWPATAYVQVMIYYNADGE